VQRACSMEEKESANCTSWTNSSSVYLDLVTARLIPSVKALTADSVFLSPERSENRWSTRTKAETCFGSTTPVCCLLRKR
jgi:hypothetical protein